MRLLFFVLLFYGCIANPECFFPESELRSFFFEVTSNTASGTTVADSLVDPTDAQLRLASIRSNNLPLVNYTDRFSLVSEQTGRFRLVSLAPLSLPSYPSSITETLLYVTVLCNGRPFPLMTIRLKAANSVAPSFLNEPYVVEVDENFSLGREVETPISVIDWDPSPSYGVKVELENNTSLELASYPGGPPAGFEDGQSWTKAQYPQQFTLRLLGPITYPIELKLKATDDGSPQHVTFTTIKLVKRLKNVPLFSKCHISAKIPENSKKGTKVTVIPIQNFNKNTRLSLVDPDETFEIAGDELLVADPKLIDRELFSTLEVVIENKSSEKESGESCRRLRIRVELEDENDNRPVFERESYWFHLAEKVSPGTEFATLKARDVDVGQNGRVTYELMNTSVPFRIYPRGRDTILATTGLIGPEDQYRLVVEASDHGEPPKVTPVLVEIFVVRPGRPVKEFEIKRQQNKLEKSTTTTTTAKPTTRKTTVRPVTFPDKDDLFNRAIDEATKEFEDLIRAPENPQNVHKPSYSTTMQPRNEVVLKTVLQKSRNESLERDEKPRKLPKDPIALGVAQVTGRPRPHLRGLVPATSTTERTGSNNQVEEETETEDLGDGPEDKTPFGFTASHYYYEVFGQPVEDDVFGRVVAEPNPQMYGLDRKAAGIFKVDPDIGELSVARRLYLHASGNISFAVSATDGVSTARAVVTVLFEPDKEAKESQPRFDQTLYKFRVEESSPPEVIGIVRAFHTTASSRSSSTSFKYSIDGNDLPFSIHPASGEIANESPLDRESHSTYRFNVRACLTNSPDVCGISEVEVSVGDVNDHAPRFSSSLLHITLPSDVPIGTEVTRVRAVDEDLGDNGAITYQLTAPSDVFAVDGETGRVVTVERLTDSKYGLLIQAVDHGQSPKSDAIEVRVKVLGTNPSAPSFEEQQYQVIITPPTPAGAVIAQVQATDPDPGQEGLVGYRFAETEDVKEKATQKMFEINTKTGVVSSVKSLSSGEGPFDLIVEAFDGSSSFSRKTSALLHIEVGEEAALRFLPLPSTIYISTEKAVGSVILRASATTTSSSPVHFRVIEDESQFEMDGDLLRVVSHELVSGKSKLTIRAETESLLFADHHLTVIAMESSDKYPVFPQLTYDIDIPKESAYPQVVALFSARVRNGSVSYELHPETPHILQLNSTTGELIVKSPDFASQTADTSFIVVRARNVFFPDFYSDVGVALNRVDQRPEIRFGQSVYRLEVVENTPVRSLVSHPLDVYPRSIPVRFRLSPADSFFGVHENGTVFVVKPIDLEQIGTSVLQFTVWAETDNGQKTSARLSMDLKDENEFSPELAKTFVEGVIREDAPPGTVVAKIDATDKDFSEGKHLLYRIVGGSGKELVFIQEDGTLVLGDKPLDKTHMPTFDVQVEVYDKNANKAVAMALIIVERINNNPPVIKNLPLKWTLKENDPTSKFIVTAESDGQSVISFRIVKGNILGNFKIESNDNKQGILSLTRPLDFEKESAFLLTLEASKGGTVTTFPVNIVVSNENDVAPVFIQKNVSQRVSADIPIGKEILKVAAEDEDGDRLQYSLSGSDCSSLTIDHIGVVSWSAPPSKRPAKSIVCQVAVSDGDHTTTTNVSLDIFSEATPTKAPVFSQTEYTFTAKGPRGAPFGRVIASDPDGDQVLLAIKPQDYRDLFAVDDQGYISLKRDAADLDQTQYSFLVSAEDWGPPIMSSVVTVHVVVPRKVSNSVYAAETTVETITTESPKSTTTAEPTSSERPKDAPISEGEHLGPEQGVQPIIKFIRPVYVYSIKSDSPIDSYLGQVHTTFNRGISFEMIGNGPLNIDQEGRIRTTELLTEGKIDQTVVAIRNGTKVDEVPVIVHVIPQAVSTTTTVTSATQKSTTTELTTKILEEIEEEHHTRKLLTFGFERAMYFAFVTEGNYTGLKLDIKPEPLATSSDGKVFFSISNKTETVPFYMTETGDFLCFNVDREQRQNYMLDIVAIQEGEEAHTLLNVTVLDVNDNYPVFVEGPDTIGLSNDVQIGSSVMTFKATDLDSGQSGQVSYDISGDSSAYFAIDRSLGVLSLSSSLASAPKKLSLTVTASDRGHPSLKSQLPVSILVFDAHSPAPLLPRLKENLLVPHDAAPGYLIKTLLAGPTTSSALEPIEYGLTDDNYGLFKIDEGRLTLARPPFPLEGGRVHQLNVTARNSLGTDSILVNVLLESYEQSTTKQPISTASGSCKFEKNVYQVEIAENQPAGIHVASATADCENPVYSLDENEDFTIDAYGQVYTKRPLDREQKSLHLIYINVNPSRTVRSDPIVESAKQHLESNQAVVIVRVLDENDNFPYFDHLVNGRLVAHVDWKARKASPVVRITAKDKDQNARLIYSIPNSELFSVDPHTGIISLKSSLEKETDDEFDISATVDDGEHQATVPITIYKLSPDTNVVRLTSELAPSRVREFQVENTLNELTGAESRVMAKGPIDGSRSAIYIYALDPETKEPIGKERIVELLQAQKTALMASPSRISDVSISKTPESSMSVTHIVLLLLVLVLVVVLLCLTCWCASYCKRRRYTTSISDREYMFSTGGGPRPYDVEAITRQTAQTVLAQVTIPSPMATHRDSAISPAFADRGESVKDFGNSVRERPGLLQSALSRHKIQPGAGSLSAVVVQKEQA